MPFDLAESFIAAAEATVGATLPISYRRHMAGSNGGEIEVGGDDWLLFPIADLSDRRRISRTANHALAETRRLSEWPAFPEGALAIAENGTGDALLFLRAGSTFAPSVHEWRHETRKLRLVANDFSEVKVL